MDEGSLLKNLVGLPVFDFTTRLTEYQLAPPGFLVVERMMVRLPFDHVWAARLIPFVCGVAVDVPDAFGRPPLSCPRSRSRSRWGFSLSMIG